MGIVGYRVFRFLLIAFWLKSLHTGFIAVFMMMECGQILVFADFKDLPSRAKLQKLNDQNLSFNHQSCMIGSDFWLENNYVHTGSITD